MRNRILFTVLCITAFCACVAQGVDVTLLATDFDGATANGTQLTGVTWTSSAKVNPSSTINSYETHSLVNTTSMYEWEDNVAVNWNLNTSGSTPRGIVSSFSAVGSVPLSELTIGHVHTTSTGWWQTGSSDMTVTITNSTDGVDVYSDTTNYFYPASGPWQSHTYDVSSVTLEEGKDYTITLTMKNLTGVGGAFASWNQISLTADDPDLAALIEPGLGSTIDFTNVSFGWSDPASGYTPDGYNLYIRPNDANFIDTANNIVNMTDGTASTGHVEPLLDDNTTYYWRVDPIEPNAVPIIHEGGVWYFSTVSAIPSISIIETGFLTDIGDEITFTTTATSTDTYQWKKDGVDIGGETGDSLTITVAGTDDEGDYTCVATGDGGSTESLAAFLMTKRAVAHWSLDQADFVGNVHLDSTVSGYDATPVGVPTGGMAWTTGADSTAEGALAINDPNVAATAGTWNPETAYGYAFSVTAWVNWNGNAPSVVFAKCTDNSQEAGADIRRMIEIGINEYGHLYALRSDGATIVAPTQVTPDVWTLVSMAYGGGNDTTIYVNGDSHTATWNPAHFAINGEIVIGASDPTGASPFDGDLDDVIVYNYALDASDIAQSYYNITDIGTCLTPSAFDVSGPEGDPDCLVTVYDFAVFAADWLACGLYPVSACP